MNHDYQKDISGCGLTGLISRKRRRIGGADIVKSLCLMTDRGNGLGAGYAAYGIYRSSRTSTPSTSCSTNPRSGGRSKGT